MRTKWLAIVGLVVAANLSAARADTPSTMLEKGIFQEETAGNLDAAVKLYKQIVDEATAQRHAVAEAQYRLGVCYQKQGKKDEAQAAFRDLVAQYPDEKDLVAKAQKELGESAPAPVAKYEPLELNPAPWPPDELMVMNVKGNANMDLGAIFYTAKRLSAPGEAVAPASLPGSAAFKSGPWRIESCQVIPLSDSREYTCVDADALTFAPITARTKNSMGDFHAAYQPGRITLEVTPPTAPGRVFSVGGTVYDNEQVIYLVRRLPLKEGYTARFPIFSVMEGTGIECRIRVDGREDVTDFGNKSHPCWKVVLSVFSQGKEEFQHQLWIEAQGARRLIKYDSGAAVLQLVPNDAFSNLYPMPDEAYRFPDADGISIKRVPGWFGYFDHSNPAYKFNLQLLPPELKAWAVFVGIQRPADMNARQIAEGDTAILKGFFKNYAVRADSWSDVPVSGLKGVSFVADYQDKNCAMVEYRTYLLTPRLVVWFVFRVDKDQFDASRAEFDKIVQSLKTSEWTPGPDGEYLTLCNKAVQAALPPGVQVGHLELAPMLSGGGGTVGWRLQYDLSEDQRRNIPYVLIPAIRNATIFKEKISFVTDVGASGNLRVDVISREEAEKRCAAAQQHETK